jgi:hypothetical protein
MPTYKVSRAYLVRREWAIVAVSPDDAIASIPELNPDNATESFIGPITTVSMSDALDECNEVKDGT